MPWTKGAKDSCTKPAIQRSSVPWLQVWILASLAFIGCVECFETYRCCQGCHSTVQDSRDLWYYWRRLVPTRKGNVVVLVGSSRMMADISVAAAEDCLPNYRVVQLGTIGVASPVGLLDDLVNEPSFAGVIICELATPLLEQSIWDGNIERRHYRPSSLREHFDTLVKAAIDSVFISTGGDFSLRSTIVRHFATHRLPERNGMFETFRRQILWDFDQVRDLNDFRTRNTDSFRVQFENRPVTSWESLSVGVSHINELLVRLRARGGNIAFVSLPSSGERWAIEQKFLPKHRNWDRFAALTDAACVHFSDLKEMADIRCPDECHLDYRDAPRFTREMMHELLRRGVFRGPHHH